MHPVYWILSIFILCCCKDNKQTLGAAQRSSEAPTEASVERLKEEHIAADFANFLAPLIDPSKLDTLKGKRAAHTAITQSLLLAPDGSYKRL
jgi:hypothetical protein